MPRKYQPNGKPNGGKRDGAGRKEGSKNLLGYGEIRAMKASGLRVPESATEKERALADRALERIIHVMEEKVKPFAMSGVLKSATTIREEICGPMKQKVEHTFEGQTDEQLQARLTALLEKAKEPPGEAGQTAQAAQRGRDLGLEGDDS